MHLMDRFHTSILIYHRRLETAMEYKLFFYTHVEGQSKVRMVYFMLYMNTRFLGRFFNSPPASQDIRQDIRPKVEGGDKRKTACLSIRSRNTAMSVIEVDSKKR